MMESVVFMRKVHVILDHPSYIVFNILYLNISSIYITLTLRKPILQNVILCQYLATLVINPKGYLLYVPLNK